MKRKKLFMFSVGSKLVLFGPAVKTQYAVKHVLTKKNSRLRVDSGFHIDQTKQIHHISF